MANITRTVGRNRFFKYATTSIDRFDRLEKAIDRRTKWAFEYTGGVIRNTTRRKVISKRKRNRSKPGEGVNSPPSTGGGKKKGGVMYRTIVFRYERKPIPRVLTGYLNEGRYGTSVQSYNAPSIPSLLEYGGRVTVKKDKWIPRAAASMQDLRNEKARLEGRYGFRKNNRGGKRTVNMRKIKYVMIPKGTYSILPRPTMRLGFNQALNTPSRGRMLERAFAIAGARDIPDKPITLQPRY